MPSFAHPGLLWGLTIAGVPVLIHLINLLRHRRVSWAAMEFLLASQKRNRARVLLRQLLLLAVRMLAIAALVIVLAGPRWHDPLGGWLGAAKTHHVVLLDDSFSMSDRWADTSAFDEARAVIERIGTQASRQARPQTFTLLRFSQAPGPPERPRADLLREAVNKEFAGRLRQELQGLQTSHTAAGPLAAIQAVDDLVGDSGGDPRIVYLVSDFRARQWDRPGDLGKALAQLSQGGARIRLIHCVQTGRPNLALGDLQPANGTRAAGVPFSIEVTVRNFGTAPARNVPVLIEADGLLQPAIKIPEILAGGTVKERFSVHFPVAGQHAITARLPTDAVATDNTRYAVLDLPEDLPVLLVDSDPEALDAQYLSAALAPGGPVRTGIRPRIEKPRYLSVHALDPFRAIYLLNVDWLEGSAIEALERYLAGGGGVGVFLGERCRETFINEALYRDGEGFFPVPVEGQAQLLADRLQHAPDLRVSGHPIFRVFAGQRNSFLPTVIVDRYFRVPQDWKPRPDALTRVIARLRNGIPLAVERSFGRGRVVALLTTAAPTWNNWARNNPSFVVTMLEMQAFLASQPAEDVSRLVGTPWELKLDPSQFEGQVRLSTPDRDGLPRTVNDAAIGPDGLLSVSLPAMELSGICEAVLTGKDGAQQTRRYAFNVEPEEGDLATLTGSQLAERLEGVRYVYQQAGAFEYSGEELAGTNLSQPLLYLLVLVLLGEQVLAWSASYHPRRPRRGLPKGGPG